MLGQFFIVVIIARLISGYYRGTTATPGVHSAGPQAASPIQCLCSDHGIDCVIAARLLVTGRTLCFLSHENLFLSASIS